MRQHPEGSQTTFTSDSVEVPVASRMDQTFDMALSSQQAIQVYSRAFGGPLGRTTAPRFSPTSWREPEGDSVTVVSPEGRQNNGNF